MENSRITVILPKKEFNRFDQYCKDRGFKKSTLIARLVREHLDEEGFAKQLQLSTFNEAKGLE